MIRHVTHRAKPQQNIGAFDQRRRAGNANRFHLVLGRAKTGGVGEQDRHAADGQGHFNLVAGRARKFGDDRFLLSSYRIDKTGFPGVRRPRDDDFHPISQRLNARSSEPLQQLCRKCIAFAR